MAQTVEYLSNLFETVIGINLEEWEIETLLNEYNNKENTDELTEDEKLKLIVNIGKENDLFYSLRWYDDCVRIRDSFVKRGTPITLRVAERLWDTYSEDYYCAGWMTLPGEINNKTYDILYGIGVKLGILREYSSEEIKEILDDYLNNGLFFEMVGSDILGIKFNNELIKLLKIK